MSDEDTLSKALNVEWRAEYAALAAEIAEEIAAGGPRKKRKKKYKDSKAVSRGDSLPPPADGAPASAAPPRSSVKQPRAGRGAKGAVSFMGGGGEDDSVQSSEGERPTAAPTVSRQVSRLRAQFSRSPAGSRSAVAAAVVPAVSFAKTSFQSGVFQSGEFGLSSRLSPMSKSWGGEFVSRR